MAKIVKLDPKLNLPQAAVRSDYDGDGDADIAVWRPSTAKWYVRGVISTTYGKSGDQPVPGDYDGDRKTDIAVWRPSTGKWYVRGVISTTYGKSGDKPVPGDYDGDRKTDIAVWRPSTGKWYVRGVTSATYGKSGDKPVPGDYDGDGKPTSRCGGPPRVPGTSEARPRSYWARPPGMFPFRRTTTVTARPTSRSGGRQRGSGTSAGSAPTSHGASTDKPVPADYDGDGDADLAVWRPSTSTWDVRGSAPVVYGQKGDVPLTGR